MVFIGFGFLMCFLKSHNWSSIGYNYLLACWAIQIEILLSHFWDQVMKFYDNPDRTFEKMNIGVKNILEADFGAAAVLISMGALVGKCSLF
jgi:ammonium transporter Rh